MSGDRLVGLIGIAMALVLVMANGGLRRLPLGTKARMAAIWIVIIVVAAAVFAGFRR